MEPGAEIAPGAGLVAEGATSSLSPTPLDARGEYMKTWLTTSERMPRSVSSLEF